MKTFELFRFILPMTCPFCSAILWKDSHKSRSVNFSAKTSNKVSLCDTTRCYRIEFVEVLTSDGVELGERIQF